MLKFSFGAWNFSLRFGILSGLSALSVVSGATASLINGQEISQKMNNTISPAISQISTFIKTQSSSIQKGVEVIVGRYKQWIDLKKYSDEALKWIKKQEIANISKGFNALRSKFKEWYTTVFEKSGSLLGFKVDVAMLKSTLMIVDRNMHLFMSLLKKVIKDGKFFEFFDSVWHLGFDNLNIVKEIDVDTFMKILEFAQDHKRFVDRIKILKSSANWGKYANKEALMRELFPGNTFTRILEYASKVGTSFLKAVTKCKDNAKCTDEKLVEDSLKLFGSTFISLFTGSPSPKK